MTGMTSLDKVSARVRQMAQNCIDHLVKVRDIVFKNLGDVLIAGIPYPLRLLAQKSICYRLGIPFEYLKRCPQEIQAENLNYWLKQEKNERLFFRIKNQYVRAIFTPRYKPVDNVEVLKRLEALGYAADTKVQCRLDEEFMALSIPDGHQTFAVNGDKITPGISIANSEVGLSSLRISAFFLRLKCTNGLIAKTEVSAAYRHISTKILEEFPEVIAGVSQELGKEKDRFKISLESKVDNPMATIQSFNRQFMIGKPEQEAVEWGYSYEPGYTMFHIVNAYTRAAQFPGLTAEASYRLEKTGGNILGMVK